MTNDYDYKTIDELAVIRNVYRENKVLYWLLSSAIAVLFEDYDIILDHLGMVEKNLKERELRIGSPS